jgi:hypothetical protein
VRAAATAVRLRSRDAKPGGRKGYRIAGENWGEGVQNTPRTPDDRSKKIRIPMLGAGPRAAATYIRTPCLASKEDLPELPLRADVRRDATGTAGSGLGVSLDRWRSADIARLPVFAASGELRHGTRDYSIGPGDVWGETAFRNP